MEKRGLTHIEMILSFVIFIGFLAVALYFFNPIKADRLLSSSAYYAEDEIIDYISTRVESYSVVLESPGAGNIRIPINNSNGWGARVETNNGATLNSMYSQGSQEVTFTNPSGNDFVKVMFSEDFVNGAIQGASTVSQRRVASFDTRTLMSERKTTELAGLYESSYLELKKDFNLPNRIDFSFSIIFDDGTSIAVERDIPTGIDVFVRERRIEIIRMDGDIVFADLSVKTW